MKATPVRRYGWAVLLLLATLATACQAMGGNESGGSSADSPGSTAGYGAAGPDSADVDVAGDDIASPGIGGAAATGGALPPVGSTVIKTADVGLEVRRGRFHEAVREVTTLAARYGGFLVASSVEGSDAREGTLTIRVPSDRFERALAEVRDLGRVKRESVEGREVGQEFVDLEARLRNLRAQETVLLRLYARANSIPASIRVQEEVAGVQLEVERLEGRLRFLQDQTAFGTLTVRIREAGVAAAAPPSVLEEAWERAVDVSVGLASGLVVGLGYALPIGLALLLLYPLLRRLALRVRPNDR